MDAPKTPKINKLEYNGCTSNKKDAGQKIFRVCTSPSPVQDGDTASCFNLIAFSVEF